MLGKNMKRIMREKKITGIMLANMTGSSKAAISQYMNGINTPSEERLKAIADALDVSVEELVGFEKITESGSDDAAVQLSGRFTMTCKEAAKLLGKHENYVRLGLQQGRPGFEFGSAVKTSGKWSYCIYAKKFAEVTGIPVKCS